MPNIPDLPEILSDAPGVQMQPPPAEYIDQTLGVIGAAVAKLGEGERGKLVWIATAKGSQVSVNVAVVNKFSDSFTVTAWIGKEFGEPIAAGLVGEFKWK